MAVAEGKANEDEGARVLAPVQLLNNALAAEAHIASSKTNYNDYGQSNEKMDFMAQQTMGGIRKTAYAAN